MKIYCAGRGRLNGYTDTVSFLTSLVGQDVWILIQDNSFNKWFVKVLEVRNPNNPYGAFFRVAGIPIYVVASDRHNLPLVFTKKDLQYYCREFNIHSPRILQPIELYSTEEFLQIEDPS